MTRPSNSINPNFFFLLLFLFLFLLSTANGQQISTACSSSLISTFTPCFNFLTGSSNGGGPSGDCCTALASLVTNSMQCACLILTGNVPLTLPFNKTISISLTRLCGSRSVPLQCSTDNQSSTATSHVDGVYNDIAVSDGSFRYAVSEPVGAPLPGPGPVIYAPSLPPLPPEPPLPSVVDSPPPSVTTPSTIASPPSIGDTPGNQRPLLILPSSAKTISAVKSLSTLLISTVLIICI